MSLGPLPHQNNKLTMPPTLGYPRTRDNRVPMIPHLKPHAPILGWPFPSCWDSMYRVTAVGDVIGATGPPEQQVEYVPPPLGAPGLETTEFP